MMKNKLLAILPCAGFGTRVSAYVPKGMYKELGCVNGNEPTVLLHLDALIENVKADIVSVIMPDSKQLLRKAVESRVAKYGFEHEISRLHLANGDAKHKRSADRFIRTVDGAEQRIIIDYVPDDLHKTQNPLDAVVFARASTADIVISSGEDWDTLVMFPDIFYTDLDIVVSSIQYHQVKNRGAFGMSSLLAKSVPELNPMKFGRHRRFNALDLGLGDEYVVDNSDPHIYAVEFSTSNEMAHPRPTHLETGILYLPYDTLFKEYPKGTWIYDMMLKSDSTIHAIDITGTKLVDLGDPMTYINNPPDITVRWTDL